jgi:hypothetical protein
VLLIFRCHAWSAPECGSVAAGSACFSCPRVSAPPGQIARSAPDSIFRPDSLLFLRAPVRFFRRDSIFLRVVLLPPCCFCFCLRCTSISYHRLSLVLCFKVSVPEFVLKPVLFLSYHIKKLEFLGPNRSFVVVSRTRPQGVR